MSVWEKRGEERRGRGFRKRGDETRTWQRGRTIRRGQEKRGDERGGREERKVRALALHYPT